MPRSLGLLIIAVSALAQVAWGAVNCEDQLLRRNPVDLSRSSLSRVVEPRKLTETFTANSDQREPMYVGATPRELALGGPAAARPKLHVQLRALGESQAERVRRALGRAFVELEAWPTQDDDGHQTWVFARWRADRSSDWQWLDGDRLDLGKFGEEEIEPILPLVKKTWLKKDFKALFTDVLRMKSLYEKPLFGDAVWTRARSGEVVAAWVAPERMNDFRAELEDNADGKIVARIVPQPARFNEKPVTFVLRASKSGVRFPRAIEWREGQGFEDPVVEPSAGVVREWPRDFDSSYERDVRGLSGRDAVLFPESGRRVRFKRKNSIDPRNQLETLVDYLEERYRELGIQTIRQRFTWRGIPQSNLVAVIPGSLKGAANTPILMADHIDTAFSEDVFNESGRRVSAPGADDNVTATAALLRAAEVLKDSQPEHDIWLVHLTGEEFPADDLGARHLVSELLGQSQDIGGLVLMDMIGYRKRKDRVFQVNPGDSPESMRIALTALDAARALGTPYDATLRRRFDPKSYLYNTDGIIFSNAGYPVVLLNEHINGQENLNRPHYHDTTDTVRNLDFSYAAAISRVAIETVARLAGAR